MIVALPGLSSTPFFTINMPAAILFNGAEPFDQIGNIFSSNRAHMKSDDNCSRYFREKDVKKFHDFMYVYSQGQGQITSKH